MKLHIPTEEEKNDALRSFFTACSTSRAKSKKAAADLSAAADTLTSALLSCSGQGEKVSQIIRSVWNGCHKVGLCDALAGLDTPIADAVVALIAARAHMGGDADDIIRKILVASGEMGRLAALPEVADDIPPARTGWTPVSQSMPDSDMTVQIFHPDDDEPVWLGYHDGETWRTVDGQRVPVTHWQPMTEPPSGK